MPIEKEEFQTGKTHSMVQDEVLNFLNEREEQAFTSKEIMAGIQHFHPDFNVPEIAMMSAYAIADFTPLLHQLVLDGRIRSKTIKGQTYYLLAAQDKTATCPKCQREIHQPKKTWMMTQRPDKQGRRLQLNVGLYECPAHGMFRTILHRQRI